MYKIISTTTTHYLRSELSAQASSCWNPSGGSDGVGPSSIDQSFLRHVTTHDGAVSLSGFAPDESGVFFGGSVGGGCQGSVAMIAKMATDGTKAWAIQFQNKASNSMALNPSWLLQLIPDGDTLYALHGLSRGASSTSGILLTAFNSENGALKWASINQYGEIVPTSMSLSADGELVVSGSYCDGNCYASLMVFSAENGAYIKNLDSSGRSMATSNFMGMTTFNQGIKTDSGDYVARGSVPSSSSMVVTRLSSDGTVEWAKKTALKGPASTYDDYYPRIQTYGDNVLIGEVMTPATQYAVTELSSGGSFNRQYTLNFDGNILGSSCDMLSSGQIGMLQAKVDDASQVVYRAGVFSMSTGLYGSVGGVAIGTNDLPRSKIRFSKMTGDESSLWASFRDSYVHSSDPQVESMIGKFEISPAQTAYPACFFDNSADLPQVTSGSTYPMTDFSLLKSVGLSIGSVSVTNNFTVAPFFLSSRDGCVPDDGPGSSIWSPGAIAGVVIVMFFGICGGIAYGAGARKKGGGRGPSEGTVRGPERVSTVDPDRVSKKEAKETHKAAKATLDRYRPNNRFEIINAAEDPDGYKMQRKVVKTKRAMNCL